MRADRRTPPVSEDSASAARGRRYVSGKGVFELLATRVADGTYPPGSIFKESEFVDEIGVSRSPVREALQRLVRVGLMEIRASRFSRVASLTAEDSRRTREFVSPIACEITRSAIDQVALRESERERVRGTWLIEDAIVSAKTGEGWIPAHVAVFQWLTHHAPNELYETVLSDIWYLALRDLYLADPHVDTLPALERLLDAVRLGDAIAGELAVQTMFADVP